MALYHLDTNVCIDLMRGKKRGDRLPAASLCRISAIVEAELWMGVNKGADPAGAGKTLRAFLDIIDTVPFDSAASEEYGRVRGQLERDAMPIGALDQPNAAHARSTGAALLAANLRDFRKVGGLAIHPWE